MRAKNNELVANVSLCKYDVVASCLRKCGFALSCAESEDFAVRWIDTGASIERVLALKPGQKINHFPGVQEICRKDRLAFS